MKNCKITALRCARYDDLIARYENPIEHACSVREGDVFFSYDAARPEGFCESAWQNLYPFVMALASGGEGLFDGWMKDPKSALISCNDGFRPVSFLIEALEENK